ncbi:MULTISPECIES: MATE family efflux transporter [Aminobacterium]|uniref:MATE family efflux transporter n=1 Tax=Aminobacterium TaxID=81466 RepID=UPI00235451AA|nr:MATE family efflux transporter [Aminobacterium sp. EBM-42]MDD2379373.1 MATE family efflux transporter [Aminobacterium colombiense]MDD3767925.1 MATE family efflux transporter [Aminobacterium colombiense]MDD4265516.1 MATE family efflux transporter [Aminobacterium colombiense]MDD4585559.1 MATE family efflux transporter [Aminobacterium colombiense]
MKYTFDPLRGSIFSVFLYYSSLTVIGMLAVSSASAIDAAFLGNMDGEVALATVTLTLPFVIFVGGVAFMMGIGGSVSCGKYLGAGDVQTASAIFTKTLLATLLFAVGVCFTATIGVDLLVVLLGASPAIAPSVRTYTSILTLFIPFSVTGICLSYFVRVDGRPLLAAVAMTVGAIVNISLDWLFVVKLHWGIQGAAFATGFSQITLLCMLFSHFLQKKGKLRFNMRGGSWKEIIRAAYNGFSEFANEISAGFLTFLFNRIMIRRLGVAGVAAYTIVNYILYLGSMACYGIGDAIQPIISKNFGAGKAKRIKGFLWIAGGTVTFLGILIVSILLLMPNSMIKLFTNSEAEITICIARDFIAHFWPAFLLIGINIVFSSYFTAMQKPVHSAFIAISRSLVAPATLLYILPLFLGNKGIYMAVPLAELATFILALALFMPNSPLKLIRSDQIYKKLGEKRELFPQKGVPTSESRFS